MDTAFDMFWETEVPENEEIISRTDFAGIITYVNDTFARISGYEPEDLVGKPHSIIRHPDMPKSVFENLWQTIKDGKEWHGYVKNLRQDHGYYWVYAHVSTVMKDGQAVGYKSVREPVCEEKKREMQRIYDEQRSAEEGRSRVVIYIDNDKLDEAAGLE
jgi:aerotaxis receptor